MWRNQQYYDLERVKQLAQEEKARRSDYTISNNGDISDLISKTDRLILLLSEKENEYNC